MYLSLFIIFLCLSLILIIIGLFRPEHSELSLAGFLFLFVLSMTIILGGEIQYKIGSNTTYSYTCHTCDQVTYTNDLTLSQTTDIYENWSGGVFGHFFGYWLAVISAVGFIGVLAGLRGNIRE